MKTRVSYVFAPGYDIEDKINNALEKIGETIPNSCIKDIKISDASGSGIIALIIYEIH